MNCFLCENPHSNSRLACKLCGGKLRHYMRTIPMFLITIALIICICCVLYMIHPFVLFAILIGMVLTWEQNCKVQKNV